MRFKSQIKQRCIYSCRLWVIDNIIFPVELSFSFNYRKNVFLIIMFKYVCSWYGFPLDILLVKRVLLKVSFVGMKLNICKSTKMTPHKVNLLLNRHVDICRVDKKFYSEGYRMLFHSISLSCVALLNNKAHPLSNIALLIFTQIISP